MKTIKRHLPPLAALFVLNLAVFARLVFLNPDKVPLGVIPWDFATQYSVWLVYIGDCIKSGFSPLWSPYAAAGTPFFINPQSQLYSPLTLLVASTVGYTQRVAQLQTVFMLFFGGVGAYALSYTLWQSRWAGLVTAICFNFSSAVFGNLQHMTITNAAALLPWLFWATTLTAREGRAWAYPVLAFFIYFLLTSGYPGVVLMALFWLAAYTAYLVLRRPGAAREKLRPALRQGLAWLLGLGLAAVHWLPIVIHRKAFTRGATPLSVDAALNGGNLSFKHLWGMLFQFMTEFPLPGPDTDISMRGLYLGALALPLAVAALLYVKDEVVPALLALTVGAFLMACGGMFFGRLFLHILFPVLNMSRFPAADSRSLMVLALAVLAGGGAALLRAGHAAGRAFVLRACVVLLAAFVLGLYAVRDLYTPDVYNSVVLNYTTAEVLFVAVAILALRAFPARALVAVLAALLALEVGTCVLANMRPVAEPISAQQYSELKALHRRAFTAEAANLPRHAIGDTLENPESYRAYLEKSFYLSEYNPLRLTRFENLIRNGFTEWMTTGPRVVALPPDTWPADYESFRQQARPVEYTILSYTPNQVVYRVRADGDSVLVFNEIYFPGWRATVDGGAAPLGEISGGLRALRVGGGEHTVVTTFRPSAFYWGVGVSSLSAFLFLLWLGLTFYRGRSGARSPA